MKQDLKSKLINRKVQKPNRFLMSILFFAVRVLNKHYKVEFSYDYDPDAIKNQPTILLASHASRLEFIYAIGGFTRKDINVVCGYQNIMKKGLYSLLMKLGIISKHGRKNKSYSGSKCRKDYSIKHPSRDPFEHARLLQIVNHRIPL